MKTYVPIEKSHVAVEQLGLEHAQLYLAKKIEKEICPCGSWMSAVAGSGKHGLILSFGPSALLGLRMRTGCRDSKNH